ncbi:MAG TPA: EAL domain-containing protein [Rhodocyclaceae bacterium]
MRDWLFNLPIGKKLWLFNLLTAMIAGVFAVALLIFVVWRIEYASAERESRIKAAIVAENALPALQFGDAMTAAEILGGLERDESVIDAFIIDAQGTPFAGFRSDRTTSAVLGIEPIRVSLPIMSGNELLGTIEINNDPSEVHRQILSYVAAVAIATMVALLLGTFVVIRLQRTITSPLAQLTELMRAAAQSNEYSQRILLPRHDEIGEMSQSFNRMIDVIKQRERALNVELGERRRAEQQLEHLAHHDPVTGLPNRHYFRRRAAEVGADAGPSSVAVLFIDIDNFKYVNDTFGHDLGDKLLVTVAERLVRSVRANDAVVRFGGDEFVVLLDQSGGPEQAMKLGEKIGKAITERMSIDGNDFFVTCSIGVAVAPEHGVVLDELLTRADVAMYVAKAAGKNGVRLWEADATAATSARFSIENALRQALANNELEMYYQPIVSLDGVRIVGSEALMRWRNPALGFVSPAEFIPVAEECGLIGAMGDWAMRTAFAQNAEWNRRFAPMNVSVNVSGRQFNDPAFAQRAAQIAADCGLPSGRCELELTESILMSHIGEASRVLHELSDAGFSIALDDFGTGYSSLAYLKRLPIDKLKIDRSFVSDLPESAEALAIAEAIVAMSTALRLSVIAEGIETAQQRDALAGMRCRLGQGYLFSRPLPPEQFAELLESGLPIAATSALMSAARQG